MTNLTRRTLVKGGTALAATGTLRCRGPDATPATFANSFAHRVVDAPT
jgi:hypothetical protein